MLGPILGFIVALAIGLRDIRAFESVNDVFDSNDKHAVSSSTSSTTAVTDSDTPATISDTDASTSSDADASTNSDADASTSSDADASTTSDADASTTSDVDASTTSDADASTTSDAEVVELNDACDDLRFLKGERRANTAETSTLICDCEKLLPQRNLSEDELNALLSLKQEFSITCGE
jgi:hypothetical protein